MDKLRLGKVIKNLTGRKSNMFLPDLESNRANIQSFLKDSSVLVIGGAGTIGSNYVKSILHFEIDRLVVVDQNENGLAELIRDLRSSNYPKLPNIVTYAFDFGSEVFINYLHEEKPFNIVANFAATKHVRSEKDPWAIIGMIDNNVIKNYNLLNALRSCPPEKFFIVSTDKATNPVNFMGASKRAMEIVLNSFRDEFEVTSARFANVAFSNGSLLASYITKFFNRQTLVCPNDVKRYFVSPSESGTLCLLSSLLGNSGDIFIPKLNPKEHLTDISNSLYSFLNELNLKPMLCQSQMEAISIQENISSLIEKGMYPVFLPSTNTSGEKLYEEFFTEDEEVEWNRFSSIGVVHSSEFIKDNVRMFIEEWDRLKNGKHSKGVLMKYLNGLIKNFKHKASDVNLDDKL